MSTAYTLGNKCAQNCCKRTILVQLIVEEVGLQSRVFETPIIYVFYSVDKPVLPVVERITITYSIQ